MSFVLSANNFLTLSSFLDLNDFVYFNREREMVDSYEAVSIDGIDYRQYKLLENVVDVSFNNETLSFLTSSINLSSSFNNLKSVSSIVVGSSGDVYFNKYYYDLYNSQENETVAIQEQVSINNNFLLVSPYKETLNYNFIPLKSSQGIDYEYDYNRILSNVTAREYDGIYFGNNQDKGYANILAQYKSNTFPITVKSDNFNVIYIPDKIDSFYISAANLENFGAIWGNAPCNSDIIFYDRFGYNDYNSSGFSEQQFNGIPLCLWLSGNNTLNSSNTAWIERWYDPNLVTQGDAFIAQVNLSPTFNSIVDKVSDLVIHPKSKITYLRFGDARNLTFVNSFSSNLGIHFNQWSNIIEDDINGVRGFSIPNISTDITSEANFDGSHHFHVPPDDNILTNSNITVGMWVYQNQWNCGIDTQYFGNFSNDEGYGLFFNTGSDSKLITFPTTSGFVYGFNNRGFRVFEKSINESMNLTASRIDYITTDLYGSRWLYDSVNKNVYKLDTDDLLEQVIDLANNVDIVKMQVDSQNNLYLLNSTSKNISGFDPDGNLFAEPTSSGNYNNFEIDQNDSVILDFADILVLDTNNVKIKALGTNIYRNNNIYYHVGKKIQAMNVDMDNNIWIIYDGNRVLKLDSDGFVVFNKILDLPFAGETSIELNFIKEIYNNCDTDVLWIVFNTNNYIIKLNTDGRILKRLNIKEVVNLKNCRDFYLNVRGDFTGFSAKRKFNRFSSNTFITSNNPAISLNINVNCGNNRKTLRLDTPTINLRGWTHIAFSHIISNNETILKLYVNGHEKASSTTAGTYFIDYGTKVSPFIIGGRSGKLGATNVEIGLNEENYFKGKINDIRIYNRPLNTFELRGLSENLYADVWSDMTWYIPTVARTYMEEIAGYHLNQYHGSKSNKFNIRIKNMGIDDEDTKDIIKSAVIASLKKFIPIHTELNEIIFE